MITLHKLGLVVSTEQYFVYGQSTATKRQINYTGVFSIAKQLEPQFSAGRIKI